MVTRSAVAGDRPSGHDGFALADLPAPANNHGRVTGFHKMSSLKQRLAEHGFVSDEDFGYPLQCLLSAPVEHLRCLNLEGDSGARRRTAFAYALGHALGHEHVLYHEFTDPPPPPPVRIEPAEETDKPPGEPPADALDRIMAEACALSEGEPTFLILDQLHQARFQIHIRLAEFIRDGIWRYGELALKGHRRNLLVVLISDDPLYHTLKLMAFSLWLGRNEPSDQAVTPGMLGLADNARPMLDALKAVFDTLDVHPTLEEYRRVVHDLHVNVNTAAELRQSIYGWVEGVERTHLMSAYLDQVMGSQWPAFRAYLGLSPEPESVPPWRRIDDAG
jgi:hypothetical protein